MHNPFKLLISLGTLTAFTLLAVGSSCNSSDTTTAQKDSTAKDAMNGASKDADGFVAMFDGKTLNGWEGDTAYWRVENGELVGEVTLEKPLKNNTFLIWKGGEPGDFEMKAEFRIDTNGNSGVQYRSEELKDIRYALKGYQADIDGKNVYTGQNYEERGRGFLAMRGQSAEAETNMKPSVVGNLGTSDSLKTFIKPDWNELRLVVKGTHMKHFINGVLMSEFSDSDTINRKKAGLIGLQVHVMPKMKVEYRNLKIKL